MDHKDILGQLKTQVFARQTVLAKIYCQCGQESLSDYVNSWQMAGAAAAGGDNQKFLGVFDRLLSEAYGKNIAAAATEQLRQKPLVSTIDHHGLLNHPFFLNSNLIFSLRKDIKYLVCLSTAGVSLNNSSWPASLVVTDKATGKLKRFSFFPDRYKTKTVLAAPALQQQNIKTVLKRIQKDDGLGQRQKEQLAQLVEEVFLRHDILPLPSFSRQASVVSTTLWSKIFPKAPKVLYLPVEDLVSQAIIEHISQEPEHILFRLLFTSQGNDLVEKYFSGSLGAFFSSHKGSFLFWGVSSQGRRVHLCRQDGELRDHDLSVKLEASTIASALAEKKIYPTSLVCFLVLLYHQITCLGGFNQVNWLTDIKEKFVNLLEEMGEKKTSERISRVLTTNFAEGNLAFLPKENGLVKATGVDVFLSEVPRLYGKYCELAEQVTVGESIESLLPEIYEVIVPSLQRSADLFLLTDADIVRDNGVGQKILKIF